jgi:zinc transport system substrate-binding protein
VVIKLQRFHTVKRYIFVLLTLVIFAPPTGWSEYGSSSRLNVFVSIPPLAYLVEEVGGEDVEVNILLEPGQSPETYDPSPRLLVQLDEARILFTVGVPFEDRLLAKIKNGFDNLRIINTGEGIELKPMIHHHDNDQHTGRPDPHIWLDPTLAKLQAATICKAFTDIVPERTIVFQRNLLALRNKLDSLDASIREMLNPYAGQKICVFHPSFGYFCDAYGLEQMAVEVEGKEPSAKQLVELIEAMKNNHITTLFVQPQFSRKSAETITKAIEGQVVVIDPLAENYADNLLDIAAKFEADLKSRGIKVNPPKSEIGSQ